MNKELYFVSKVDLLNKSAAFVKKTLCFTTYDNNNFGFIISVYCEKKENKLFDIVTRR